MATIHKIKKEDKKGYILIDYEDYDTIIMVTIYKNDDYKLKLLN